MIRSSMSRTRPAVISAGSWESRVPSRAAVGPAFRERPLWVTGGKTPSEYIFSELPQVADIVRSAFHHLATHWYCGSLFWVQANPG